MSAEEEEGFQEPTAPGWMATFGDLMSLLLTFFVLLMSFASMDVRRFAAIAGSMRDAFGVQKIHPGEVEALSTSIVNLSDTESSPYLRVIDVPTRAPGREQALLARLRMTITGLRLERVVEVENTSRGVVVRVPGQLLFDAGSAELRPESLVFLREIAELMREMPDEIAIEGHTDATPVASADLGSNWELSAARAIATLRYLVEVGGVDPSRLRATGFGATRPLVPNEVAEVRARNRRVEFVFLKPDPAPTRIPDQSAVEDPSASDFALKSKGFSAPAEWTPPAPAR